MRTGTAVLTDDQPKETRRPAYPARVIAHGIRSVPSTPPLIGGRPDRAGEPVRRGGARVRRGINHRGNATHRAGRGHRDRGVAALPQEAAVDGLRTGSQNRNIPLRRVAADLVDKTVNPTTPQALTEQLHTAGVERPTVTGRCRAPEGDVTRRGTCDPGCRD